MQTLDKHQQYVWNDTRQYACIQYILCTQNTAKCMCRCEFSMDTHIHSVSLFFPFSFSLNTNFFFVLLALSLCILAVHCYFVLDFFFLDASCFCTLPTPQYAMECILTERWSIQCHDILMLPSTCIFLLYCFFFFLFKYSVFFFLSLNRKIGRTR